MIPFLLFLILLAVIGGGALVGNFLLTAGGLALALILIFTAPISSETKARVITGLILLIPVAIVVWLIANT